MTRDELRRDEQLRALRRARVYMAECVRALEDTLSRNRSDVDMAIGRARACAELAKESIDEAACFEVETEKAVAE